MELNIILWLKRLLYLYYCFPLEYARAKISYKYYNTLIRKCHDIGNEGPITLWSHVVSTVQTASLVMSISTRTIAAILHNSNKLLANLLCTDYQHIQCLCLVVTHPTVRTCLISLFHKESTNFQMYLMPGVEWLLQPTLSGWQAACQCYCNSPIHMRPEMRVSSDV